MRPQVVRTCLRNLEIDKSADRQRARHEDQPIDLRRVPPRATDGDRLTVARFILGFADGLDQHLQRLPTSTWFLRSEIACCASMIALRRSFAIACRHRGQIECDRLRARLRRVGEDPDVVELLLLNEIEQGLKLPVGLAWVADDERRAHHNVGHLGTSVIDQAAGHGDVAGAVHVPQHGRVGVLDRHVEIGQKRIVLGHDVDHAQSERAGVDVEHAQPGRSGTPSTIC